MNALAKKLLAWFAVARRDLPWREEPRDPYRVWVSEVMLQQTRVEVVVPYFLRFVDRLPTLAKLAAASPDEVLSLWSGLGYYTRARNLHRAAQAAGAALPGSYAELRELPGFGPYTAAAVASLAFGEDQALVDGNVARVLGRLYRLAGDKDQVRKAAWELAPTLLPRGRGGAFNEALMELGALVCTPRKPRCDLCPVASLCQGRDVAGSIPAPKARRVRPLLAWDAVALRRRDSAVLLAQRPEGALFAGLWDLPEPGAHPGVRVRGALSDCGVVEQTLTHREVSVTVRTGAASGVPRGPALRFFLPSELSTIGLSSLARKSLRRAGVLP